MLSWEEVLHQFLACSCSLACDFTILHAWARKLHRKSLLCVSRDLRLYQTVYKLTQKAAICFRVATLSSGSPASFQMRIRVPVLINHCVGSLAHCCRCTGSGAGCCMCVMQTWGKKLGFVLRAPFCSKCVVEHIDTTILWNSMIEPSCQTQQPNHLEKLND